MDERINPGITAVVLGSLVACIVVATCIAVEPLLSDADAPNPGDAVVAYAAEDGSEARHEHEWVAVYETDHHDAVTEVVDVPAEYSTRMVSHTVCNECGTVIDGVARDHIEATGHRGYTTGVPRKERYLVSGASSYTRTVSEAYDEELLAGFECIGCGEVMGVREAA